MIGETTDDGCTQCTCRDTEDGPKWSCTLNVCNECMPGEAKTADDGCNMCTCGDDLKWSCTDLACPNVCTDGEMKPAGDDCNTCHCVDGAWQCTRTACMCTEGDTKPAGDGCNTCMCHDGVWGCTMALCNPPECTDGMADCDAIDANGCETDIEADFMNCGACGYYCGLPNATPGCDEGQCVVATCNAGYADCNGDPLDGCEAPVGAGGCEALCNVSSMMNEPVPAQGDCECPAGTACVRGSIEGEDPDSEYCFPIPDGCDGFARCGCMSACACPADSGSGMACFDQMAIGGVFIINCAGQPVTM